MSKLLNEGRRSAIALGRQYKIEDDTINTLISFDPSETKKYSETLMRLFKNGNHKNLYEDPWYGIQDDLLRFHEQNGQVYKKDFGSFKNIEEFIAFMKEAPSVSKRQYKLISKNPDSVKKIFENDKVLVVRPLTREASCIYGAGATWCISAKDNNQFNSYSLDNTIYFVLSKEIKDKTQPYHKIAVLVDKTRRWDVYDVHDEPFGRYRGGGEDDEYYESGDRFDELQEYLNSTGIPDTIFRYIPPTKLESFVRRFGLIKTSNGLYNCDEYRIYSKDSLPPDEVTLNIVGEMTIDSLDDITVEDLKRKFPKRVEQLTINCNDDKLYDLSYLSDVNIEALISRINIVPTNIPPSVKRLVIAGGHFGRATVRNINLTVNTNIEEIDIRSSIVDTLANINRNIKQIHISSSSILDLNLSQFNELTAISFYNIPEIDFTKVRIPHNIRVVINNSSIIGFSEISKLPIKELQLHNCKIDSYSAEYIKHIPAIDLNNNKYAVADFGGKYDKDKLEINDSTNFKNVGEYIRDVFISLTKPKDLSSLNLKKCTMLSIGNMDIFNQCNLVLDETVDVTIRELKTEAIDLSNLNIRRDGSLKFYSSNIRELKQITGVDALHRLEFTYCNQTNMNTAILSNIKIDEISFNSMGTIVWDYIDENWTLLNMSSYNIRCKDEELKTVCSQVKACNPKLGEYVR